MDIEYIQITSNFNELYRIKDEHEGMLVSGSDAIIDYPYYLEYTTILENENLRNSLFDITYGKAESIKAAINSYFVDKNIRINSNILDLIDNTYFYSFYLNSFDKDREFKLWLSNNAIHYYCRMKFHVKYLDKFLIYLSNRNVDFLTNIYKEYYDESIIYYPKTHWDVGFDDFGTFNLQLDISTCCLGRPIQYCISIEKSYATFSFFLEQVCGKDSLSISK